MRSIRVFLFALVAICLLLAASAFALVVQRTNAIGRQQVEAQAQETTRALSQAVDQELERGIGILAALGASEAARKQDWASLDRQARAALRSADSWIVVHDRSGQQLVNTRLAPGAPLPRAAPPAAMWSELTAGKPRVCNLVSGVVERNIVCVDWPIGNGPQPQYAVSMIFKPSAFGSIVTRADVGSGNIATLVDRSNRIIWRNTGAEEFVGREATGKMLEALRSASRSGILETRSLEGVDMLSAFNRSTLSGWAVIVGTPLRQIESGAREAFWRGSMIALSVLLFGGALALLLGARLVSAVNALADATASGSAEKPARPTGFREIDAAAEALRSSFAAKAESDRHQQMLVGELNHRVKNTLSIVQSLAHQTFRSGASPKEAIAAFESRLQALASAHNLLTQQRWEAAPIPQVVQAALNPFCDLSRCRLDGPDLKVSPQTAVSLALAVHELATNASKYGALATEQGTIDVQWTAENGSFSFLWRENGGPPVQPPTSEGFGMRLIKRGLASELRGAAQVEFNPAGVLCRLSGRLKPA